jgi:hypothetical protein
MAEFSWSSHGVLMMGIVEVEAFLCGCNTSKADGGELQGG